jgi:CheY-like chemotaxis protein
MNASIEPGSPKPSPDPVAKTTSELNNVLQTVSGTSSLIPDVRDGGDGSEKYLAIRASIERAEKMAAELVEQGEGSDEKMPMHPEIAAFVKGKRKSNSETAGHFILVVDDDETAVTLLKRILTERGFQVVTAHSGFECLDLFRRRPYDFDLVLLDLIMPFMDGEETFARLQEIRPDVAVMLCTGVIQQERLKRLKTAGLAGFLRKPIAPDEVGGLICSTLQSVKYSRGNLNATGSRAVI